MNWLQRKIYLYNVTFGLYMLDWWERCLFNTLVVILMWFVLYNGSRYAVEFSKRYPWKLDFAFPFSSLLVFASRGLFTNGISLEYRCITFSEILKCIRIFSSLTTNVTLLS